MPPKNKNKRFLEKQKALEEAKAAKDAAKAAVVEEEDAGTKRPTAEELGFFVRTGPDAAMRANAEMNIIVDNIQLFGGKTELVQFGTLHLTYGMHYGLVGRNGVGKSCMLRAIAEKVIKLPEHLHIIHVEQECVGDQRTALETVVGVDKERSWLIELEQRMMDLNIDEERGITLRYVKSARGRLPFTHVE
jgi:ABC-type molybdenum transport system ATPase subunit/photorepair protein PhrA